MYVKPKKSLGQHFLTDQNIARKIVDSLADVRGQVFEIGPGMGVLTKFLKEKYPQLVVIEIDTESVLYLKEHLLLSDSQIIEGDFLRLDSEIFQPNCSIIGNFPYNISSQIFFKVLDNKDKVSEVVCMIQKEVAERISAPPGSKTYGILSVLLQAFYDIKYLFTVHENVFNPPPKVKSAVIRLSRNNVQQLECNEELFFKLVKAAFNQRRKTLRNSVRSFYSPDILQNDIFNKRPEQLSVAEFVELTKMAE